jgi:hypothetical protein
MLQRFHCLLFALRGRSFDFVFENDGGRGGVKQTRTDRCAKQLVDAQTCINRAVHELNAREYAKVPGRGHAPDDDYTLRCVIDALKDLSEAADVLLGKTGVRG